MRAFVPLLFAGATLAAPFQGLSSRSYNSNAAAYFLDNNPAGSSIVALKIDEDGQLCDPVKTPTGGIGALEVNATGSPATADGLGSQGAVVVKNNLLFTVNAGSHSLSMFQINPNDPLHPVLIGKPVSTLGEFPISVDYSAKLNKACVLNSGAKAGVACFAVDATHGLTADGPLRTLSASIINETTPPHAPPGSAAQVLFNPASTAVFATIKGNPGTKPITLGSLLAWPVDTKGAVSAAEPVVTRIDDVVLDFGFQFIGPARIFLADPSFGAAFFDVQADLTATQAVHTVLPGQKAVCWTRHDPHLDTLYAIDAGQNLLYTLDPASGRLTGNFTVDPPAEGPTAGLFDSAIRNSLMYSLAATNGIHVTDLAGKKAFQYFDLTVVGERPNYQGMAVWP